MIRIARSWKRSVPATLIALAMLASAFAPLALAAPVRAEVIASPFMTSPSVPASGAVEATTAPATPTHTHTHHHHVRGGYKGQIVVHSHEHPVRQQHCEKPLHRHAFWIKPGGKWKRVTRTHCTSLKHQRKPKKHVKWHRAKASWYGPGLYGNGMAGGGVLRRNSMVVAHKSLPFGTKIQFKYHGRKVTAVVRDRGPFVRGRKFDLGPGTARKLRFGGVGTVTYRIVKYGKRR